MSLAACLALVAVAAAIAEVPETCFDTSCEKEEVKLLQANTHMHPSGPSSLSQRDVARAKQLVPGPAFIAAHGESNTLLNKHLLRITKGNAKPCNDFTMAELDHVLAAIDQKSHPGLQQIHESNRHPTDEHWTDPRSKEAVNLRADKLSPELLEMATKEKKCYDAAMHFTHSISDEDKKSLLSGNSIPLLPERAAHETNSLLEKASGEQVFNANCAACHAGGQNVIMPDLTLEKEDLNQYLKGGNSINNIKTQVTNGKNAMPAFGGRLSDDDIDNVAEYVSHRAGTGWW
ncbi:petJ [Symbiodinium natans]|uniref:Cytochrome c-553 n=1 Tax=Symbiodinium natans TaxID=878477 RepID=A0A812IH22_9DINO|nr:petJ [Symbiodinium natans]